MYLSDIEIAWHYIKSSPPVPANILEVIIQTCYNQISSPQVIQSNIIQIAEGAFTKLVSLPCVRRENFILMLKFCADNHCNTQ